MTRREELQGVRGSISAIESEAQLLVSFEVVVCVLAMGLLAKETTTFRLKEEVLFPLGRGIKLVLGVPGPPLVA